MTEIMIEIDEVETTNFFSEKSKKTFYKQPAYLHKPGKKHPDPIVLFLGEENKPYPVGMYTLDSSSYYADKFKSLAVSPKLVAIKSKLAQAS